MNTVKSFILFDSGAQHTYITKKLKKKLNLIPFKQEKIAIKVFDSTESKVQNIDVVKFIVMGARKNVYVEALVITQQFVQICIINIITRQFQIIILSLKT